MNAFTPNTEGVFENLPAETYHAAPGLSHSMCKHLEPPARLPVYMKEKREPTAAMIMGTLVHQRILEPEKPMPRIAVKPDDMKFSTTVGKAWRDEQEKAGKLILKQEEWDMLGGCIESVSTHPTCKQIFEKGRSELSAFLKRGDVLTKFRMDFVPLGNALVDIKTTRGGCADKEEFSKILYDERYYTQASWYLDGWNTLNPHDKKEFFSFVVVEKVPPYLVSIFVVDDESMALGRKHNERDLESYSKCVRENHWPGFDEMPQRVGVPKYAIIKNNNEEHAKWSFRIGGQQ